MEYDIVIGLEVHTELSTSRKIFCGCTTAFGGEPNTHVCEVCLGMPGALPVLNKQVVDFAIRTGLATNCRITRYNKFDRKNYFYPDLPKAYQISQLYLPICQQGYVALDSGKKIHIKEIHMEEDAGKLIHNEEGGYTLVDYNRCGVPLLEIVSDPDFTCAEEVQEYLEKLKAILQYTGVSDCKMQEGSLRADINLSVKEKGAEALGVRTEMKNLNSFRAIGRAIEAEAARQIKALEKGEKITQETRRWDDRKGESYAMRSKEDAHDYKYFPEPDIPPIEISEEWLSEIKSGMPELPDDKKKRYIEVFGLPEYDASIITGSLPLANLFEETAESCGEPKEAAKWIMGDLMKLLNESGTLPEDMKISGKALGTVIKMLRENKISRGTARKVFEKVITDNIDPEKYVKDNNLAVMTDTSAIKAVIENVVKENTKSVDEYKSGKEKAIQFLIGQSMRALKGQAPAGEVTKILHEILD